MTDTRARRAIETVACPACRAPIGEQCRWTDDERRKLGPRIRSLPIHGERRKAYQEARDAETPSVLTITIVRQHDQYRADIPAIGCTAHGKTYRELLTHLADAIYARLE